MRLLSVNRTAAAGARPSSAAACPRLASRTAGPAKRNVVRRFKEEIKGARRGLLNSDSDAKGL